MSKRQGENIWNQNRFRIKPKVTAWHQTSSALLCSLLMFSSSGCSAVMCCLNWQHTTMPHFESRMGYYSPCHFTLCISQTGETELIGNTVTMLPMTNSIIIKTWFYHAVRAQCAESHNIPHAVGKTGVSLLHIASDDGLLVCHLNYEPNFRQITLYNHLCFCLQPWFSHPSTEMALHFPVSSQWFFFLRFWLQASLLTNSRDKLQSV